MEVCYRFFRSHLHNTVQFFKVENSKAIFSVLNTQSKPTVRETAWKNPSDVVTLLKPILWPVHCSRHRQHDPEHACHFWREKGPGLSLYVVCTGCKWNDILLPLFLVYCIWGSFVSSLLFPLICVLLCYLCPMHAQAREKENPFVKYKSVFNCYWSPSNKS